MTKKVKNPFSVVVHQDNKSAFIKAAGRIYRPVFPEQYGQAFESGTKIPPGTRVHASVQEHGPLVTIQTPDKISEHWFSHGELTGFSESAWKPTVYLNWN